MMIYNTVASSIQHIFSLWWMSLTYGICPMYHTKVFKKPVTCISSKKLGWFSYLGHRLPTCWWQIKRITAVIYKLWAYSTMKSNLFSSEPLWGVSAIMVLGFLSICLSIYSSDQPLPRFLTDQPSDWRTVYLCKRFLGIIMWIYGRNGLKCGVIMSPDYLQNWSEFGHMLIIL